MQTIRDWPDPVQHEGIHVPLEYRPRKKKHHEIIPEGSILEGIMFALCLTVMVGVMYLLLM